ncbi:MAG: hypothetical protein ACFBSG_14585 [Leptolyngbyaceae cyanobacterium]
MVITSLAQKSRDQTDYPTDLAIADSAVVPIDGVDPFWSGDR